MDGLKLAKCKENFEREAENVGTEFDAFFKQNDLNAYYSLRMDESDEYTLQLSKNCLTK